MIRVHVEILPWLTRGLGTEGATHAEWQEEVSNGTTVGGLIVVLCNRYPQFGEMVLRPGTQELRNSISVIVNDRLLELLQGESTVLHEGDRVAVLPAYSGG